VRSLVIVPILNLLVAAAAARGGDDLDPIEQDLKGAVEKHQTAVLAAKNALLSRFDKAIAEARSNESLSEKERSAAIEELRTTRVAFDAGGAVPADPGLKSAVVEYQRAVDGATADLDAAYAKAIEALQRQGDEARAAQIQKDRSAAVLGEGHELVGDWTLANGENKWGLIEIWKIRKTKGSWSVNREFHRGEPTAGRGSSTVSKGCRFSDGSLQFFEHWIDKPFRDYVTGDEVTIQVAGDDRDELEMSWTNGNKSGNARLVRAKPPKPRVVIRPKPPQ
jgi:hypothetical protein